MSVKEKLAAYVARKNQISKRKDEVMAEIDALEVDHAEKTLADFGVASGKVLGLEQLVKIIEIVAGDK
jgi:predicted metal-binding transcription factor (methanogenesis marker protein 9)